MTNDSPAPTDVPRRRWFRPTFSLRTLFIVLTLLAIAGLYIARCERQRLAITEVENNGGSVTFPESEEAPLDHILHPDPPGYAEQLRHYFWESPQTVMYNEPEDLDFKPLSFLPRLQGVYSINYIHNGNLPPPPLTNGTPYLLSHVKGLRTILLDGRCQQIDDDGALLLSTLPELEHLQLTNSVITDKGLSYLLRLPKLKSLGLPGSLVTDEGLSQLAKTPSMTLVSLGLARTAITDDGVRTLLESTGRWDRLDISDTKITDAALESIGRQGQLRDLSLSNTLITDETVARLAPLSELEWLDLRDTLVTDASLPVLRSLKRVRAVYLGGTAMTKEAKIELENELIGR